MTKPGTARGRVTIHKRRDGVYHAVYSVHDHRGRLIFRDDGTASVHWQAFVDAATLEVRILHYLEAHDYETHVDFPTLVERARI